VTSAIYNFLQLILFMSGPLLIAQQTAVARVRTLSPNAAARLMRNAIRTRRGVVKSITILAPLLETNKYIVLSLPSKAIQQLMGYVSSLNASKRQAFVSGWISKNQVALITQHASSGYRSRFSYKIVPIPKSGTLTPRPVAPRTAPRRTTPQPTARKQPAALLAIPAALRPKFKGGSGTRYAPYAISIPVPSRRRANSRLYSKGIRFNIYGERTVPVVVRLDFIAEKAAGRVTGRKLATAVGESASTSRSSASPTPARST